MTIGIFGGTFNPPHYGHLIVAESVQDQMGFDKVLFIPSSTPPHKSDPALAAPQHRLELTRLAVGGNSKFEVSDVEVKRGGTSYTVDTLGVLAASNPGAKLTVIIGADNFLEIETWKSVREVFETASVVVMNRQGYTMQPGKSDLARMSKFVNVPSIGISSTDIRRRVKLGRSIRYLVPQAVEDYIRRNGLYKM